MKLSKIAILIFSLLISSSLILNAQSITIGFIPGDDPKALRLKADELEKMLSQDLGFRVSVFISPDYGSLSAALKSGKVQFAFLNAANFVQTEKEVKLKVLLKKVFAQPYYYSTLLVKKKSSIKKVKDLKSKSIIFVDRKSTSGYLYPVQYLSSVGINPETDFSKVEFSGNHERSVNLLSQGAADVAAVFADDDQAKTGAVLKYLGKAAVNDFRVIWVSEPIPNDPFCVQEEFYIKNPKMVHDLMFALLEASEKWPDKSDLLNYLGIRQLAFATSKQYDPVRKVLNIR